MSFPQVFSGNPPLLKDMAIEASLATPQGLSFDGSGNLYIADLNNKLIRKVETKPADDPMPDAGAPDINGMEMRFNLFIPAAMQ